MGQEHKRRQYFIDPVFQSQFILKFCAVVIVASLLVGVVIFWLSQNSTTVAIENTRVLVKSTSDFLFPVLTITVLTVTVFTALVVLILTLLYSHRIAGPIFRLKREITLLKHGGMERNFTLRQQDQLQALAASLAEMSDTLRGKHLEINNKYHLLNQFLQNKDFPVSVEERKRLEALLEDLSETLNYFKV
jgi:methyl-accepting chemotaxis protein